MDRIAALAFAACLGGLCLSFATDATAQFPPSGCTTGTPASLVAVHPLPLHVASRAVAPLLVQALDSAGHPLRGVAVTFEAPASGAGGAFHLLDNTYHYVPTPDPLTATIETDYNCFGTPMYLVANGTPGAYQVTASAGTAPPLAISIVNDPAPVVTALVAPVVGFDADGAGKGTLAHTGKAFGLFEVKAYAGTSIAGAGVPVTYTVVPGANGATGAFEGGASSATLLTDFNGRAIAPVLIAGDSIGQFSVPALAVT